MKCNITSKTTFCLVVVLCLIVSLYNVVIFHRHDNFDVPPPSGLEYKYSPRAAKTRTKTIWRDAPLKKTPSRAEIPTITSSTLASYPNETAGNNTSLEALSSVDYYACCGLGHRLVRMASAYFIAKRFHFTLRSFWGFCGETEAFSYLFRPPKATELGHVTSYHKVLPVYIDVKPGFQPLRRGNFTANPSKCLCQRDEIQSDLKLYSSLRERFRGAPTVNRFVQEYFSNRTVLGIHVRAGNGEAGDFEGKGRGIANPERWVQQVASQIQLFLSKQTLNDPPLVYIASDTPSMMARFRKELQDHGDADKLIIPIVEFAQNRLDEGCGVLFGETAHQDAKDEACLQAWEDALTDMLILSHSDVVIAGKPSTFVQSAPLSLSLAQKTPKLSHTYCEVDPVSILDPKTEDLVEVDQALHCYSEYMEWCCNAPKKSTEMLIVWDPETTNDHLTFRLRDRKESCPRPPKNARRFTRYCLPQTW
jgi:hypothetical protein